MQRIYLNSRASSCIHSFQETNYLSRGKVSHPAGSCFRPAGSDLRSAGRDLHPTGRDTGLLTFPRSVLYVKIPMQCCLEIFCTDAQPTSSEAEIYEVVKAVLDQSTQILQDLKDYQGANEPIRAVSKKLYYYLYICMVT